MGTLYTRSESRGVDIRMQREKQLSNEYIIHIIYISVCIYIFMGICDILQVCNCIYIKEWRAASVTLYICVCVCVCVV